MSYFYAVWLETTHYLYVSVATLWLFAGKFEENLFAHVRDHGRERSCVIYTEFTLILLILEFFVDFWCSSMDTL